MKNIIFYCLSIFCSTFLIANKLKPIDFADIESLPANRALDSCRLIIQNKDQYSDSVVAATYKLSGNIWLKKGEIEQAIQNYTQGMRIAKEYSYYVLQAQIANNLALANTEVGEFTSALVLSKEAVNLDSIHGSQLSYAQSLNVLGIVYEKIEKYKESLQAYVNSYKIQFSQKDTVGMRTSLIHIGNIYLKLGNNSSSKENYFKALRLLSATNSDSNTDRKLEKSEMLYAIGNVYLKEDNLNTAMDYFQDALEIQKELGSRQQLSKTLTAIGNVHSINNDFETALQQYIQALQLKSSLGDKYGQSLLLHNIGDTYKSMNKPLEAIVYLEQSISIAQSLGVKTIVAESSQKLIALYNERKEFEKSLAYSDLYVSSKLALAREQSEKELNLLRVEFNTEEKERENEKLRTDALINDLKLKREQWMKRMYLIILGIALLLAGVIFRSYQQKKKSYAIIANQNEELEGKNKIISEKNKEITDSIEYAKKIQEAMLSRIDELKNHLSEHFIFFKPRDIVSGDFYWFSELSSSMFAIAAIDCTGHGVPGALMSMLGGSFLKQIVSEGTTHPSEILLELHENIRMALKQHISSNKDGMDLALCVVDKKSQKLYFAGAKNPLVIVENGKAEKIKGSPYAIGGDNAENGNEYTVHEISTENKSFYMFSDGYQDQFGGPKGKKYMVKQLIRELEEMQNIPMTEQRIIIEQSFNSWKGSEPQVDDVLVIGFKV